MPHMANLPWIYMFMICMMIMITFTILNSFDNRKSPQTKKFSGQDNKHNKFSWEW